MVNKEYYSVAELAKILGISRIAVFKKIQSGTLLAHKIGRNFVIHHETVEHAFPNKFGLTDNTIYVSANFIVESHLKPFVSREEGGNLRIRCRHPDIPDRSKFSPSQAIEFMRLTIVAGLALEKVMSNHQVPIIKINYQEMGNWAFKRGEKPIMHMHIFGRAKNAKHQRWPEAVYLPDRASGFYDKFKPLKPAEIKDLRTEITRLLKLEKFKDRNWKIR
jgi:excisionase family DNA binding protein